MGRKKRIGAITLFSLLLFGLFTNCGKRTPLEVIDPIEALENANNNNGSTNPSTDPDDCSTAASASNPACFRTKITGVAYCIEYQNGSESFQKLNSGTGFWEWEWRWTCGDGSSLFPSTWVYLGSAHASTSVTDNGCGEGETKNESNKLMSQVQDFSNTVAQGKYGASASFEVAFSCEKQVPILPQTTNEILGAYYCKLDRSSGLCVADSSIYVGSASPTATGGCTTGTRSFIRYGWTSVAGAARPIIAYACIKGAMANNNAASFQPSTLKHLTGYAYCGESGTYPNYVCSTSSLKQAGDVTDQSALSNGNLSQGCINGAQVDEDSCVYTPGVSDKCISPVNTVNKLRGFACRTSVFSLSTVGVISGVGFCAEYSNDDQAKGCGGSSAEPSTWKYFGTAQGSPNYCISASTKEQTSEIKGRDGGLIGYICERNQSN